MQTLTNFDKEEFFDHKGRLLHDRFSEWLMNKLAIKRIIAHDESSENYMNYPVMYFNGAEYKPLLKQFNRIVLSYIPGLTIRMRNEVKSYILARAEDYVLPSNSLIGMKNGVLDIDTGDFYTDKRANPVIIHTPIEYLPQKVSHGQAEKYLQSLGGDEGIDFFCELLGYALMPSNMIQKLVLLHGPGGDGKSTFLRILEMIYGTRNTSHLSMEDFGERFKVANLNHKIINIGDDLEDGKILHTSMLKNVTSGEVINAEYKGQDPFEFRPRVKLFFSCNVPPQIYDTSEGMQRRLLVVPFENGYTKNGKANVHILDKIQEDNGLSYLFNKSLEGYRRLSNNHSFSVPKYVQEKTDRYFIDSNPTALFVEEYLNGDISYIVKDLSPLEETPQQDVYELYISWRKANGHVGNYSKKRFTQDMGKLGYITKRLTNGSRVYIEI